MTKKTINLIGVFFVLSVMAFVSIYDVNAQVGYNSDNSEITKDINSEPIAVEKEMFITYGNPNASVVVDEYASLSCGHCKKFYDEVFVELKEKYIDTGRIKFNYHHFPLNLPAFRAAQMVECEESMSKKQAYKRTLFKTQKDWAYSKSEDELRGKLGTIAKIGGMDLAKLNACFDNKQLEEAILTKQQSLNKDKGITSTPTIFINGAPYKGKKELDEIVIEIEKLI